MKRLIIPLIALSLALAGLLAYRGQFSGVSGQVSVKNQENSISGFTENRNLKPDTYPIDADKFLVPELYESAWSTRFETRACESYRGAIVNHHALASDLIVKVMRELARCRPQTGTVIILSPDHFNAGSAPVTTHRKSYATAGAIVTVDEKSVDRLLEAVPTAGESTVLFDREHGVGVLIPFLHRVLPDASIVPVVIKSSITNAQRAELAKWLEGESKRGNFILVSSDMSHYLDDSVAIKNDEATKQALVDSDTNFFSSAKDAFTDNGPSIAATIEALRPRRWLLIDQAISNDYAGSSGFTTTYLVGFWY